MLQGEPALLPGVWCIPAAHVAIASTHHARGIAIVLTGVVTAWLGCMWCAGGWQWAGGGREHTLMFW